MNIAEELYLIAEKRRKEIEAQEEIEEKEFERIVLKNCDIFFNDFFYPLCKKIANDGEMYFNFNCYINPEAPFISVSLGNEYKFTEIYRGNYIFDGEILQNFLKENGFFCRRHTVPSGIELMREYFEIGFEPYFPNKEKSFKLRSSPKGPARIEELLKFNSIAYKREYYFSECKYQKPLPFDFAIFSDTNKIKCLIEYDGEQHFKYIEHWHKTEEGFKQQQLRDKIKTEFPNIHNIKLIRIPYTEYDNIEKILKENNII